MNVVDCESFLESNSVRLKMNAMFHYIAYNYSQANWDSLVIILEVFHGRISLNLVFLLLLVNFMTWFMLELTYISLNESIVSSLTHLHGFQLLLPLPYLIEVTFLFAPIE